MPAAHDALLAGCMEAFMETFVGPPSTVIHENESRFVHVDVHLVPPGPERDIWVAFTTGMSALPMKLPSGACQDCMLDRAELVLGLPADWFTAADVACGSEVPFRKAWPIRLLRRLARYPHECRTWFDIGHTIPNGNPPKRYTPECRFDGAILLPPVGLVDLPSTFTAADGRRLRLMTPFVLHRAEMDFKLRHGLDALLERLDAAGATSVLDARRRSVVR